MWLDACPAVQQRAYFSGRENAYQLCVPAIQSQVASSRGREEDITKPLTSRLSSSPVLLFVLSHHCLGSWPADALPVALLGMNAKLMVQCIQFVADHLLASLGNEKHHNVSSLFDFRA